MIWRVILFWLLGASLAWADLPHAIKTANGLNYTYDLCGNMLTRGSQALVYNPENRLIASVVSNQATTFGYDAGGNRLWKQGAPTNTLQVWIAGNYEEKDGKILFHISAGDRMVYTYSSDSSVAGYYHPDHLHSAEVLSSGLTGTLGQLYQHYEYAAYGNSRYTYSTTAFPITRRYTSQSFDEETGLYYYGARYYDPVIGRFIQPDRTIANIINPQAYDRYSYALNNPFLYVDPTGKAPTDWANAMQPGVDSYYGGYISDPGHTSTLALFGAYMGQSVADSYVDMLRLGTGTAEGSVEGVAADLGRAGGIILTVTGSASRLAEPTAAPEAAPASAGTEVAGSTAAESATADTQASSAQPLVPKDAMSQNAPKQVTPGTSNIKQTKLNQQTGKSETSSVHYDNFGRQVGRTDYTDHGRPKVHPDPHHHTFEYDKNFPDGKKSGVLPGPHPNDIPNPNSTPNLPSD